MIGFLWWQHISYRIWRLPLMVIKSIYISMISVIYNLYLNIYVFFVLTNFVQNIMFWVFSFKTFDLFFKYCKVNSCCFYLPRIFICFSFRLLVVWLWIIVNANIQSIYIWEFIFNLRSSEGYIMTILSQYYIYIHLFSKN